MTLTYASQVPDFVSYLMGKYFGGYWADLAFWMASLGFTVHRYYRIVD